MTTTQIFTLPESLVDTLAIETTKIEVLVNTGEVPEYPVFVDRLFKKMVIPQDNLIHAALGIAGEAGELVDAVKKHWAYGKPIDEANLIEELGDLRFYYQALLNMFGLTDDMVVQMNQNKLLKRYQGGFYTDAAAIARADKQPLSLVSSKAQAEGEHY